MISGRVSRPRIRAIKALRSRSVSWSTISELPMLLPHFWRYGGNRRSRLTEQNGNTPVCSRNLI